MYKLTVLLIVSLFCANSAAEDSTQARYKKGVMTYWMYGGSLGDPTPPTTKDRKIAISIEGQAAREMFDAIGPDKRDECTEGSGTRARVRDKGNLTCTRSKEGQYECSAGFDLRDGKSIGGSIC